MKLTGFLSEAITTTVETPVSQLDSGYITKTSLKATTVESTVVHSIIVGSPQNQEQGAFGSKLSITTFGGNSDNPINIGDELKYQDLMDRVTKLESSVDQIKGMITTLVQNSKPPPTNAKMVEKIWSHA
ncbi:hypothetical protein Hanom_Chr16g01435841 [Helianthus anomalus]